MEITSKPKILKGSDLDVHAIVLAMEGGLNSVEGNVGDNETCTRGCREGNESVYVVGKRQGVHPRKLYIRRVDKEKGVRDSSKSMILKGSYLGAKRVILAMNHGIVSSA